MELGTRGPLSSQCTACAASNMAIGEASDAIRLGRADVDVLRRHRGRRSRESGSPASARCARSRGGTTIPSGASRPFDADRDGFVMGEAGAVIVLEELEHAQARGAKIYAELLGYGALLGRDAHHRARPDRREPGARDDDGVRRRGHRPEEVDYINAHGTSTPLGDASETRVIKRRARRGGARARRRSPSTKGATGHCLGAAGAVEAIFTTLAVTTDTLPPTINYETPDPECDLDYIPNESREADVHGRGLELVRLRRPQRVHRAASSPTELRRRIRHRRRHNFPNMLAVGGGRVRLN